MEKLPQISEAEYEIMKILWARHPLSTNEICEKARQTHDWNQKTIHTLLSRLTAKHAVSYEQRGRMYHYFPLISQSSYLEQENHHFLDRFYDGRVGTMFSAFLSDSELSDRELQDLYDLLDAKRKQGEGP